VGRQDGGKQQGMLLDKTTKAHELSTNKCHSKTGALCLIKKLDA